MEAICICSSGNNRRASGFSGWTTLDHLSGVFIDPSLRSLVDPAASSISKRSEGVLRTILWRFAASGQQHCQASIEAISNTGGTSQEFPQSFAGDLQLADVATGRGLMWGYDVGTWHFLESGGKITVELLSLLFAKTNKSVQIIVHDLDKSQTLNGGKMWNVMAVMGKNKLNKSSSTSSFCSL